MAYKKTTAKRDAPETTTQLTVELDKKKQVSVRGFNGVRLVDIREFYIDKDTKERKPGKKGISLTEDAWRKLLDVRGEVNEALSALGGKKRKVEDAETPAEANSEEKDAKEAE